MDAKLKLRLHHVGYVVKEIPGIAAAYGSRYGYEAATGVIHDPVQTALVQFLKLPEDGVYLEFVAPDGPESKLTNAVKRQMKLNHLCFTAGPLEGAIAELEERGCRLISQPAAAVAFAGRRICWLMAEDGVPMELVERLDEGDLCLPGLA